MPTEMTQGTTSSPLRAIAVHGMCQVRIDAPDTGAVWDLRIPEALSCDEGLFKSDYYPIVDWGQPDSEGAIWHAWEASASDLEAMSNHPSALARGDCFIGGLGYRVAISPRPYGLKLEFSVMNQSTKTFHYVTMFPCLSAVSLGFQDDALDRTTIVTDEGLTALKDTDRGTGDPVRTHYLVAGRRPMPFHGEWFWGKPSHTVARRGAILRTSADGRFTIGVDWDHVCEIYNNEDAHHHCIHSVPLMGDIGPGQTCTAQGKIVFVTGRPQLALERLQAWA